MYFRNYVNISANDNIFGTVETYAFMHCRESTEFVIPLIVILLVIIFSSLTSTRQKPLPLRILALKIRGNTAKYIGLLHTIKNPKLDG